MQNPYRNTIIEKYWSELSIRGENAVRSFYEYPTERNCCFVLGYLNALRDVEQITHDCYVFFNVSIRDVITALPKDTN